MPSYNAVWIPAVAVAYTLALAFLIYAWEHMYGSFSRILMPRKGQSQAAEADARSGPQMPDRKRRKAAKIEQVLFSHLE